MPLDPLVALGLAGNIIQFVDFGTKIFATARKSYKSPTGMLPENVEVVQVTTELERLTDNICTASGRSSDIDISEDESALQIICRLCSELSGEIQGRIAKLIVDKPELDNKKNSKLHHKYRSFCIAMRGAWNEKELASLMKRLDTIRNTLELQILVGLRRDLNDVSIRSSERFKQLDQKTQTILDALLAHMKQPAYPEVEAQDQTRACCQLLSRVDAIVTDHQRLIVEIEQIRSSIEELRIKNGLDEDKTPEEIAEQIRSSIEELKIRNGLDKDKTPEEVVEQIRSSIEELKIKNELDEDKTPEEMAEQIRSSIEELNQTLEKMSKLVQRLQLLENIVKLVQRLQLKAGLNSSVWDEERAIREAVENNILESLRFSTMNDRQKSIDEAHEKTFEWIFKAENSREVQPWSNFPSWLESGSGIYWINGKAASGKSTLMKFIYSHKRTQKCLAGWAKPLPITTGIFYFWNSGTPEQRSQKGLLRGILFEVLRKHRELLPVVFPRQWASDYTIATEKFAKHRLASVNWTLSELRDGFSSIPLNRTVPMKFCFFIDGLDEFDGDYEEMAQLFQGVTTPELKFCISSRPLLVLEDLFRDFPGLRLQNLTFEDITIYVRDKLNSTTGFLRISNNNSVAAKNLINEVVTKADGVFLWVRLVVKSLLQGIGSRDTISDLQRRLTLLPGDLEALYHHVLANIDPFYRQEGSEIFQVLQVAQELADDFAYSRVYTLLPIQPFTVLWLSVWRLCRESQFKGPGASLDVKAHTSEVDTMRNNDDIVPYLKSRCANLLECDDSLWSWSLEDDGNSTIRYMHRTVRDYLAKKEARELLLISTADTGFNPFDSYLRTCVILITSFIKETGKSCQIAELALMCASHIDSNPPQDYFSLLDQLEGLLTKHQSTWDFVKDHWSWDTGMTSSYYDNGLDFLAIAVQYGLVTYVSYKMSGTDQDLVKLKKGRPYLYYAVSPTGNGHDNGRYINQDTVQLLLQRGSNPNGLFEGKTPWEKMLSWLSKTKGKLSQKKSLEVIRICQMLLESGADPNAHCVFGISHVAVPARSILAAALTDTVSLEKSELLLGIQRLNQERLQKMSFFSVFYIVLRKLLQLLRVWPQ